MNRNQVRLLYWTPRAIGILYAVFISLFALDVFAEGYTFWETTVALLIHLTPTYLVLIALAVAWRWERIGGVLFLGLGVFYIAMSWDPSHWSSYLIVSGPLFVLGMLFMMSGRWRRRLETSPG
jgi:hypothetical protein